jgi:hypothetical protein
MSSNAAYIYDFTNDNQSPSASTLDRQLFSISLKNQTIDYGYDL